MALTTKAKQILSEMARYILPFLVFSTFMFAGCEKDNDTDPSGNNNNNNNNNDTTNVDTTNSDTTNSDTTNVDSSGSDTSQIIERSFSGEVQKGPFVNGSVEIYNLPDSTNLRYNGDFHKANIGSQGRFNLSQQTPPHVRTEAEGQYFNEVRGEINDGFTMESVTKAIDSNVQASVNTIGDLVFSRIDNLMPNSSFNQARQQAVTELISNFQADPSKFYTKNYSEFDLTAQGYENSTLLAVSAITQGWRNASELENLLRDMENDFAQNGQLSKELGDRLVTSAYYLRKPNSSPNGYDYSYIGQNLVDQISSANPDSRYEDRIEDFIQNSSYEFNRSELYNNSDLIKITSEAKHTNLVDAAINGPDTVEAEIPAYAGLAAKVPAGEDLTVKAINKVPSGSRLKIVEGTGWKETQNDVFVAKHKFPPKEEYEKSKINHFGDYATFEVSSSLLSQDYRIVVDF